MFEGYRKQCYEFKDLRRFVRATQKWVSQCSTFAADRSLWSLLSSWRSIASIRQPEQPTVLVVCDAIGNLKRNKLNSAKYFTKKMLPNHCFSIWACISIHKFKILTTSYEYKATLPLWVQYSYLFHTGTLDITITCTRKFTNTSRRQHHRFTRSFNRLSSLGSLVPLSDCHLPYWGLLVPRRSTLYSLFFSFSGLLTLLQSVSHLSLSTLFSCPILLYSTWTVQIRFHTDSIQWVLHDSACTVQITNEE